MVVGVSMVQQEEEEAFHLISPADSEHNGRLAASIQMLDISRTPAVVSKQEERRLKKELKRAKKAEKKQEKRIKAEEKRRRKAEEKERKSEEKRRKKAEGKAKEKSKKKSKSKGDKTTSSTTSLPSSSTITTQTADTGVLRSASLKETKSSFIQVPDVDESEEEEQLFMDEDNDSDDEENNFIGNFEFTDQSEKKDFVCLSPEDLFNEHNSLITEVAEVISISQITATALLKHHKWNKDKLLIAYFENPSKVLDAAGVSLEILKRGNELQGKDEDDYGMCSVCCDNMNSENSFSLSCCHRFCKDCWSSHIVTKIGEGESMGILCPSYKCSLVIDESSVRLLTEEPIYKKYKHLLLNCFVLNNEHVKWCPAPGCGEAILGETVKSKWVKCSCGYRFCFECINEAHAPATCEHVRSWQKKMNDESETQNWISANTMDCPKCKCVIEKNGGCNHMTCRQCAHEFCWLCLRDWKGHNDFYTCNRYLKSQKKSEKKKSKKSKSRDQKELHRLALERYLHFYSRYLNHDKSRAFEKLREDSHNKMIQLQETEATNAEVQFIAAAADKLQECRLALKYSYVVGYYLPESHPSKALFEYLQENLEKTTEQLTEALESQNDDRVRVIDLTRLIDTRLNNFLDWQWE